MTLSMGLQWLTERFKNNDLFTVSYSPYCFYRFNKTNKTKEQVDDNDLAIIVFETDFLLPVVKLKCKVKWTKNQA